MLNYIYQFQNQKRFKDLASFFKFAMFQLSNTKASTTNFKTKFMIQNNDNIIKGIVSDLKGSKYNSYRGIELNINQIRQLFPIQESIIESKDYEEFTLINKMFSSFSTLCEEYIDFGEGLHLTMYKALYKN